jgi:hypothetical protein
MSEFIIRMRRILFDIQGSYALIRQLVGSDTVTVAISRLIRYWATLPLGLRVLLAIVLFYMMLAAFCSAREPSEGAEVGRDSRRG